MQDRAPPLAPTHARPSSTARAHASHALRPPLAPATHAGPSSTTRAHACKTELHRSRPRMQDRAPPLAPTPCVHRSRPRHMQDRAPPLAPTPCEDQAHPRESILELYKEPSPKPHRRPLYHAHHATPPPRRPPLPRRARRRTPHRRRDSRRRAAPPRHNTDAAVSRCRRPRAPLWTSTPRPAPLSQRRIGLTRTVSIGRS
ncbi:hypothetical protein BDA96_10G170100 [Sorghum bicolor]|uniref:Uncharacterized protein n=1 Tax=Sorghum bicolor TaxID=4558 RepID=A0A921Q2M7_SORBI|nr:hypothetical protein BDA96_10G170100 [Sorghum bicolor]